MNGVVFLDRDGVINADIGYLWRREDFVWIPGAPAAIRLLNERGRPVVVVTNQSGVARGYYTEQDVESLHRWMNAELNRQGARIDAFYFCPHHPDGAIPEYTRVCDCRKPQPGMLLQAMEDWRGDPAKSVLIGDKESDVAAAAAAGIRGYLFDGKNLLEFVEDHIQ